MRLHILYLLTFGVLFSCNSNSEINNSPDKIDKINIKELEEKGFKAYQKEPKEAIPIFKKVASIFENLKNLKKAGLTNLNISNIYDEHLNQIDSSLIYAEKSLTNWKIKNDSMEMANLYKYIGFLNGKKGQFEGAKLSTQKAITIYKDLGFKQGIAVSEINLADTYFREKKYEKSIVYFNSSKEFWLQKNEKSRIYTDNILGIKIFSTMKRDGKVERLIKENKEIEKEIEINSFVKNKFNELTNKIKKKPATNKN